MAYIPRIPSVRRLLVICLIASLSISYISIFSAYHPVTNTSIASEYPTSASMDNDYIPIDTDGVQPVGNITIESINTLGQGIMETSSVGVDPKSISFTYIGYEWIGTPQIAYGEKKGLEWWEGNIELRLNETVRYDYYANDTATLLSYRPELLRGEIVDIYINSSQKDVSKVEKSDLGGFLYNYSDYHTANPEGVLIVDFIYDFNVTILQWSLHQKQYPYSPAESPYLDFYNPVEITSYYNYTFQFGSFSANLTVDLIMNLPDVEYMNDLEWFKRYNLTSTLPFEDYTQLANSSFRLSDIKMDARTYIIDFTANHKIEIVNQFSDYWRRDYLTDGTSTRVRDFDISVIEGPPHLLVSNFRLNLTEFNYEECFSVNSTFGRNVGTYNIRDIGERTQNGTRLDFLSGTDTLAADYYLVLNEVDSISIKYLAPSSLMIKIVDKINTPLKNAEVKLNFGTSTNATYGTFISENLIIPYAYKITNSLGYVYYPNVPKGNYTVDVYYQNQIVAIGSPIDTYTEENVVYTSVPHFPGWIILFASTSAIICAIGYIILKRAKF